MTALRRAIGALRYVNDELMRANEAIFRPVGAPRADRRDGAARPAVPAKTRAGDLGRAA